MRNIVMGIDENKTKRGTIFVLERYQVNMKVTEYGCDTLNSQTHMVPGHLVPHNWFSGQMVPNHFSPHGQMVPQNLVPMDKWSPTNLVPLEKWSLEYSVCPGGKLWWFGSMGTKLVGDHLSMGTKFLGTICPWGQEVGDRKSGDQMGLGPNESQP